MRKPIFRHPSLQRPHPAEKESPRRVTPRNRGFPSNPIRKLTNKQLSRALACDFIPVKYRLLRSTTFMRWYLQTFKRCIQGGASSGHITSISGPGRSAFFRVRFSDVWPAPARWDPCWCRRTKIPHCAMRPRGRSAIQGTRFVTDSIRHQIKEKKKTEVIARRKNVKLFGVIATIGSVGYYRVWRDHFPQNSAAAEDNRAASQYPLTIGLRPTMRR